MVSYLILPISIDHLNCFIRNVSYKKSDALKLRTNATNTVGITDKTLFKLAVIYMAVSSSVHFLVGISILSRNESSSDKLILFVILIMPIEHFTLLNSYNPTLIGYFRSPNPNDLVVGLVNLS